jgi:hypothetical protein
MESIRFAASAAMTLIVLGFAALLWGPSFEMPALGAETGIGRGALPQFCVVAASVLVVIGFVRDVLSMRRQGAIAGPLGMSAAVEPRRVVIIGFSALALLAGYVAAWAFIGFPLASIAFLLVASLMLLPRERWDLRSLSAVVATGVLFGLGIWALFVYVLQVPLR